jgi:uncharacterized protein YegJ (DUF2314 family)
MKTIIGDRSEEIILPISEERAEARRLAFQERFTEEVQRDLPMYLAVGGRITVKAPFRDPQPGARVEHMWVEVRSIDLSNRRMTGILVNYPNSVTMLQVGQCVQISFADLSEMIMDGLPTEDTDTKEWQEGKA